MKQDESSESRDSRTRLTHSLFLVVATFVGIVLAGSIAWNRAFQVDEIESIHAAFNLATGELIYRDFWQGHHPLLYGLLSLALPIDSPSAALLTARIVSLLLFCSTVALSGLVAHRLSGVAWISTSLLVFHTTFVERGIEVRPDTLMTPLIMAALLASTARRWSRTRSGIVQGLLLGIAFLATQKAAIASFAFGCVWLCDAVRSRDWRQVVLPCAAWAMPFLMMLFGLHLVGALDSFVTYNLSHPASSIAGEGAARAGFSAAGPLLVEGSRNIAFVVATVVCLGLALVLGVKRDPLPAGFVQTWVLGLVWIAGLFVMPFPYPYSHVGGLPAIAVVIGVILPWCIDRRTMDPNLRSLRVGVAASILIVCAALTSGPRLLSEIQRDNDYQLHLIDRVDTLTSPGDPVFDLAGLYFRPDAYPVYLMTGAHFVRYQAGDYPGIAEWLSEHGLSVFLVNYRVKWLDGADRRFLQSHFVRVEPNIFMSGRVLDALAPGQSRSLEVTREDAYRFDGDGELHIDGRRFERGVLAKGTHELRTPSGIESGRVVLARAPAFADRVDFDLPVFHPFD